MGDNKEFKMMRLNSFDGRSLSYNGYNAVIGLTLLWGIAINVLMALFLAPLIVSIDYRVIIVVYIILSLACISVIYKSHKPAVSLLGFSGLAVAMGLLLTHFLAYFSGRVIYGAFLTTGIIVSAMMLISMFYPDFFLSLGRTLSIALISSIIIEFVGGIIFHMSLGIMDYVVVVVFAGYIGYDWSKAQEYPKTLDNAIDSAADIYVDIINIFIRVLSIMGKNDKK